jgi:hypothetical protein
MKYGNDWRFNVKKISNQTGYSRCSIFKFEPTLSTKISWDFDDVCLSIPEKGYYLRCQTKTKRSDP